MSEGRQSVLKRVEADIRHSPALQASFLGHDRRGLDQIIAADLEILAKLGVGHRDLAERMKEISAAARRQAGSDVLVGRIRAYYDQWKGKVCCPWPNCGQFDKAITVTTEVDTGRCVSWSDLNIHLIAEHAFFEGIGSPFRLEPADLAALLF